MSASNLPLPPVPRLHSFAALAAVVLAATLLAGCGTENPAGGEAADSAAPLGADAPNRPVTVPAEFVVTPNGYFHPSCVVELSPGERLGRDGNIHGAAGAVRPVAPCRYPRYKADGQAASADAPPPQADGWAGSAYAWRVPVTSLSASWTVPSAPTQLRGQTIYLFPGLEPGATGDLILQPVLAWNGFNDRRWTIASWNCCPSGHNFRSAAINVNPRDQITASVTGIGCDADGVCAYWTVQTASSSGTTTLSTDANGEVLDYDFAGAVEVYGLSSCKQYPASGGIQFRDVKLLDGTGASATPVWVPTRSTSMSPQCLRSVTVSPTSGDPTSSTASFAWSVR